MPPPAEGFAARFVIGPALRTQPDRRLVTLVREGYENAFEEIVRRYGKPLTRYAAAIVGSRAEDVTQDSFSKALLALRRDGAEIELRPWLFRIVRNTALNDLRDSPPSAEALAEVIAGGAGPAEELERREELADLMRRLQSLPEAQRAAIVMRELEGLSHEEIAGALGLSDGGARQAIYRARRSLRDAAGLLPLPLLKAMLAGAAGSPAVEAAAGAAGVGGAAGAGVALKAAAATVLVAGAVGTGVAIDHGRQPDRAGQPAAAEVVADGSAQTTGTVTPGSGGPGGSDSSSGQGRRGERESGDDHGGPDNSSSGSGGGSGREEPGDDRGGGPGSSGHDGGGGGSGGHQSERSSGGSSGPGSGGSSGGSSGDDGGSESATSPGSGPSGDGSGSGSGSSSSSGSGSGPGGESGSSQGPGSDSGGSDSGGESGDGKPNFDASGDSHGGSGFSVQMEPQTEEES